ncbi:hypothetical protein A6R68_20703 [Neotoma lepida]|uniref:Uncharacterized protein n=1 Tax=Neotoma lepida TaxID=56216 RepID=A0A1A6HRH6_NEOLE|nr:hypothetical protein A6R68_20703 [Neotoma lepida]
MKVIFGSYSEAIIDPQMDMVRQLGLDSLLPLYKACCFGFSSGPQPSSNGRSMVELVQRGLCSLANASVRHYAVFSVLLLRHSVPTPRMAYPEPGPQRPISTLAYWVPAGFRPGSRTEKLGMARPTELRL